MKLQHAIQKDKSILSKNCILQSEIPSDTQQCNHKLDSPKIIKFLQPNSVKRQDTSHSKKAVFLSFDRNGQKTSDPIEDGNICIIGTDDTELAKLKAHILSCFKEYDLQINSVSPLNFMINQVKHLHTEDNKLVVINITRTVQNITDFIISQCNTKLISHISIFKNLRDVSELDNGANISKFNFS
ncbi:MAG: hypothetical protein COB76_02140 [Alphaproteobacteria bacterium]|nr:MAG: hypothetical protein COB76_02140 [Alphaproteobacteria bacterium]